MAAALIAVAATLLLGISTTLPTARTGVPLLRGPYLGQRPPGVTPQPFAPGVISTDRFEFGGAFSRDGKELLFTRRPDYAGSENRIYSTRMLNGVWTAPAPATFADNCFEFLPVITPTGARLFFYSERRRPDTARFDGNLWCCARTAGGWGEARFFESPINRKYCMTISVASTGKAYFAGKFNRRRGIFRADLDCSDSTRFEYLPDNINSLGPAHPFIAGDESYLIFDAQVSGMGKPELFVSFRAPDGSWSGPRNLGPEINATKTEFSASVSPDGKYLFFHRRTDGNGDIYWVSAKVIEDLTPGR